jgi:5-methylcytosine-specific restriction endonuclease McrA
MTSVADDSRDTLEARGEYVVRANAKSGWFAIFPQTWRQRVEQAIRDGRDGPNLVVCRTETDDDRDHYVIPHSLLRDLLVDSTLTHSEVNGTSRWNFTLTKDKLHVSHSHRDLDVGQFHGARLITEETGVNSTDLILANEVQGSSSYPEGSVQRILVNRYERDARARAACVAHYGTKCHLCEVDFATAYGPLMAGFIHVHHLKPLSAVGAAYTVDPIADLRPICPNCHAVVHRKDPPLSLEEVRGMMNRSRG